MNRNLSGYQFSSDVDSHTGAVEASLGDEHVGHIYWARQEAKKWSNGEIMHAYVDENHRRKGIASHLLGMAKSLDPNVHHSTDLTPAGRKFAKATR